MWQTLILVSIVSTSINSESTTVPPECMKDPELGDLYDNVVRCPTNDKPEYTECCHRDDAIGCCKPGGDQWDTVIQFAIWASCVTFLLILILFLSLWCNTDTFPWLEEPKERIRKACGCVDREEKRKNKYHMPKEYRQNVNDWFELDNPDRREKNETYGAVG